MPILRLFCIFGRWRFIYSCSNNRLRKLKWYLSSIEVSINGGDFEAATDAMTSGSMEKFVIGGEVISHDNNSPRFYEADDMLLSQTVDHIFSIYNEDYKEIFPTTAVKK